MFKIIRIRNANAFTTLHNFALFTIRVKGKKRERGRERKEGNQLFFLLFYFMAPVCHSEDNVVNVRSTESFYFFGKYRFFSCVTKTIDKPTKMPAWEWKFARLRRSRQQLVKLSKSG